MFLQTGLLFLSQHAFGGGKKKKPTFALFFLTTQSSLVCLNFSPIAAQHRPYCADNLLTGHQF